MKVCGYSAAHEKAHLISHNQRRWKNGQCPLFKIFFSEDDEKAKKSLK
jgi:hypothetical protein